MVRTHFRLLYAQMIAVSSDAAQQDGLAWAEQLTTTASPHILCWRTSWTCSSNRPVAVIYDTPACYLGYPCLSQPS